MIAALLAVGLAPALADAPPPEPDGYRMDDFRSPTPLTLTGAVVADAAEAERLWRAGEAVFIDVMPRPVRPEGLPEGVIWRDPPHDTIPGATWLANTGYGALSPEMDARFGAALEALAAEGRPLLFFCLADCWMSWNAARRALKEHGHARVIWFPEGTDGWAAAGLPLERAAPAEGF
ncbi:MAG: PQQ-dependent catabolism-associated CXXCW motif protein [Rhodobacteraceae bacterium]|nr:MAG: PQQ-dependent catabolism-associated CXXCW motif protein [Paracoccaceae bacterium]